MQNELVLLRVSVTPSLRGCEVFWRFTSWPVYYLHTFSINHQNHSHAQCQTASSVAGSGAHDKGQVGPRRRHLHPPPSFFIERCDDRQTSSAECIWWAIINTERNQGLSYHKIKQCFINYILWLQYIFIPQEIERRGIDSARDRENVSSPLDSIFISFYLPYMHSH